MDETTGYEYVKRKLYNFFGKTDYSTKEVIKELKKRKKMPRKSESFKKLATILAKLLSEEGRKWKRESLSSFVFIFFLLV